MTICANGYRPTSSDIVWGQVDTVTAFKDAQADGRIPKEFTLRFTNDSGVYFEDGSIAVDPAYMACQTKMSSKEFILLHEVGHRFDTESTTLQAIYFTNMGLNSGLLLAISAVSAARAIRHRVMKSRGLRRNRPYWPLIRPAFLAWTASSFVWAASGFIWAAHMQSNEKKADLYAACAMGTPDFAPASLKEAYGFKEGATTKTEFYIIGLAGVLIRFGPFAALAAIPNPQWVGHKLPSTHPSVIERIKVLEDQREGIERNSARPNLFAYPPCDVFVKRMAP